MEKSDGSIPHRAEGLRNLEYEGIGECREMKTRVLWRIFTRPGEFVDLLWRTPRCFHIAVVMTAVQVSIAFLPILLNREQCNFSAAAVIIIIVSGFTAAKFHLSALFLSLALFVSGGTSGKVLYRQSLSTTVYACLILLLGRMCAAVIAVIIALLRNTEFTMVSFVNVNTLLSAFDLPTFLVFEKADIFAAWFIGLVAIGVRRVLSFNRAASFSIAAADWLLLAAFQESLFQYLRSPIH